MRLARGWGKKEAKSDGSGAIFTGGSAQRSLYLEYAEILLC